MSTVIDDYIAAAAEAARPKLRQLRELISAEAPQATERLSWHMPTFYLNGNLVHFAAHRRHIGLYPGPDGVATFADELGGFKHSKGAIQFPLDRDLPAELIRRIVRWRYEQQLAKR